MAKRKPRRARKPKRSGRKPRGAAARKLPKNAVTLIVILRAREGQETLLEAELRALVSPSRREAGCLTYNLHRSIDAPVALLRSEEHTSELQSHVNLVCRLLLEKKKKNNSPYNNQQSKNQ